MKNEELTAGQRFGKLTLIEPLSAQVWRCRCDCGNESTPQAYSLLNGHSKSCGHCGKNYYKDQADGLSVKVTSTTGVDFIIDKADEPLVKTKTWCVCTSSKGVQTVTANDGTRLHQLLLNVSDGYEVDHINLNRLDNRRSNLRVVTHQQNQMNHPLQKNNTSGAIGVRFYPPRNKYVARIKVSQHDIHLGYYKTFLEAVQARNVGTECMFGVYGRYSNVPPAPKWIRDKVVEKCMRFSDLSANELFAKHLGAN